MEKLKENYINIDPRLEYMEQIATLYVPDIDIDPSTGEKYICAKSDAIYYKENITAKEKKISSADNACSLLSDGNIIYYVEGSSSNSSLSLIHI